MSEAGEGKQSTETTGVPEGVHEAAPEGESLTRTWGEWGGAGWAGARPRAGESPRQTRGPAAGTGRIGCQIEAIEFSLDPESNKRQGSVFIMYTEEEPVRNILEKFHTITGSKRSDNENENDYNTNASMIPSLKKKAKQLCYFNDKWKDTYDWISEK
uniref:Uncharacterized protein n=1 Tax=Rousettus aegyptiacus TaxID=9407 RepID=A0A7J8KB79_ROUAE|nr:hypothetical protein HJG63_007954 [Rousettus aegyptiacus]